MLQQRPCREQGLSIGRVRAAAEKDAKAGCWLETKAAKWNVALAVWARRLLPACDDVLGRHPIHAPIAKSGHENVMRYRESSWATSPRSALTNP